MPVRLKKLKVKTVMDQAKVQEGQALMAEGDKALNKKTFFGSKKPDYDSAVFAYEQAATCFKVGRAHELAVDAFVKSAECHKNLDSMALAAKQLESAAIIAVQNLKQYKLGADLYKQTSDCLLIQNSPDRAAECLEKAGKAMENTDSESAMEYYLQACDLFEEEDRGRFGTDTFRRTVGLLIIANKLDKAVALHERLADVFAKAGNTASFVKTALGVIIIALYNGDEVDAKNRMAKFNNMHGWISSQEGETADEMLRAYENRDSELLAQAVKRPWINNLENEITRIARLLAVPGGGKVNGSGVAEEEDTGIL
ncbi:hypothetical protein SmJEL517_g00564 [Synchytrium microbalum]|uniref:Gamma-soluble NSF attachment protein n=1 Tax=Synchytrium microbalum TaxID=1806994 RepID=A0A507CE65_9FUNG|nr:uncharacterized protein SmJEL517_g00564 [Synchytrium microbalum]TPX37469.1 hypothetical protein SmJEL517_g00564 [Synchytrium microbalum]